ncbi:MAG: ATP-binding cassette domain-containing protein [Actinomycetia bacterium]|nr:ATP-binding cassette domain-containing protein [Actinomycetes bacterium]
MVDKVGRAGQTGTVQHIEGDAICARQLKKRFSTRGKTVEAVAGVDLSVRAGEIFGFLGPNGAGKTTTLRMLTTLLPIDSGEATVAGADVRRSPARVRRRIGYVSQLGGADENATGRDNLMLQGRLYGTAKADMARQVDELLALLDLAEFADRRVATYSGGQRRRLDVALGIAHQPQVLFLDEPSTGLDPQNRANLWTHVRGLAARGTTVFLTTHYLEEADALCDRVAIIDHGLVVAQGPPTDLKHDVAGDSVLIELRDVEESGPAQRLLTSGANAGVVRELSVEDNTIRLYVTDSALAVPALLRSLDEAGIAIRSLRLAEPSLDDVFLAATGRSLRDAGDDHHDQGTGASDE